MNIHQSCCSCFIFRLFSRFYTINMYYSYKKIIIFYDEIRFCFSFKKEELWWVNGWLATCSVILHRSSLPVARKSLLRFRLCFHFRAHSSPSLSHPSPTSFSVVPRKNMMAAGTQVFLPTSHSHNNNFPHKVPNGVRPPSPPVVQIRQSVSP